MSIFHPDYMLWRMDVDLKEGDERFDNFTPEEKIQYFHRLGWTDANGVVTPEFEPISRYLQSLKK